MEKQLNNFESESLIRQAFEVIDYEGLGYITLKQLRHVVHDLGLTFTDEEMSDMIDEADPSGDGRVSYQGNIYLSKCFKRRRCARPMSVTKVKVSSKGQRWKS